MLGAESWQRLNTAPARLRTAALRAVLRAALRAALSQYYAHLVEGSEGLRWAVGVAVGSAVLASAVISQGVRCVKVTGGCGA